MTACLPATGLDGGVLAILFVAATLLLIAGGVLIARKRSRIALLLVPVAAIALVLGGTGAQPAQAVTTAIPSVTIGATDYPDDYTVWTWNGMDSTYELEAPLPPQLTATVEALTQLYADGKITGVTQSPLRFAQIEAPFGTFEVAEPDVYYTDNLPVITEADVDEALDSFESLNPMSATLSVTYTYNDDCGAPLQTTITWTGLLFFIN